MASIELDRETETVPSEEVTGSIAASLNHQGTDINLAEYRASEVVQNMVQFLRLYSNPQLLCQNFTSKQLNVEVYSNILKIILIPPL